MRLKFLSVQEEIPAIRKTGCYSAGDKEVTGDEENTNEAGIENVMETRKPSIVTMAKAFSIMGESMDRTMGLCMQEKLNLYRFFCTTYGLPAPKDLPTEESCNSAAAISCLIILIYFMSPLQDECCTSARAVFKAAI